MKLSDVARLDKGVSYSGKYLTLDGPPLVNLKCFGKRGIFRPEATKPYTGPFKARHVVRGGDLILANTDLTQAGEIIGNPALVPESLGEALISHHLYAVRVDKSRANQKYLYYRLQGSDFKAHARACASGTTVLGLRAEDVLDFEFDLPSLRLQEKAAAVLAMHDLAIHNTHRRTEVLEQMMKTLFNEWFIDFRFPDYESSVYAKTELGPLPTDWRVRSLGECAKWLSGGTPPTHVAEYWNGPIPWITSGSLTTFLLDDSERKLTSEGVAAGSRLVQPDTLLFVVRGMSLAKEFRYGMADVPLSFGQDCKALVAEEGVEPLYLAFAVGQMAEKIQKMVEFAAHGTGKLSTDRLKALLIRVPPLTLQLAFVDEVTPLRQLIRTLRRETEVLTRIRNKLLPKVISQEISLSELDIDTSWLAA